MKVSTSMMYHRMSTIPLFSCNLFIAILYLINIRRVHAVYKNTKVDGVALQQEDHQQQEQQFTTMKKMPPRPNCLEWNQQHIRNKKNDDEEHEFLFSDHSNSSNTLHEVYDVLSIDPDNKIAMDITRRRLVQDYCVTAEPQLRLSISAAPNYVPTRIDICTPTMTIDASSGDPIYQGINIQNKNLDIRCNTTTPRCILDAQGRSRHFYANQTTVTFRDIVFLNGNSNADFWNTRGGSIWAVQQSNLLFERCQFRNNTAGSSGGAINSDSSNLTFVGGNATDPTLFESNTCLSHGGAIHAKGRNPTITATNGYFVFRNNTAGEVRILFIIFDDYHVHLNTGILI
jgi:predicted outer membrane repeat protein